MSILRVLTIDDAPSFVEIRRLSLSTDPLSFSARPETDAWSTIETARRRFSTATPEDGPVVLGAFDPNLVGVVGLIRSSGNALRLWGFYVRPERRRGGLGRALLQQAIEIARQMPGVVRLELGVGEASRDARRAYEKIGFRETALDTKTGTHEMTLELEGWAGLQPRSAPSAP